MYSEISNYNRREQTKGAVLLAVTVIYRFKQTGIVGLMYNGLLNIVSKFKW